MKSGFGNKLPALLQALSTLRKGEANKSLFHTTTYLSDGEKLRSDDPACALADIQTPSTHSESPYRKHITSQTPLTLMLLSPNSSLPHLCATCLLQTAHRLTPQT